MINFYLDLPLGVHIPECVKHPAKCFRLQSPQFNCNLSNPTAISAMQLQSPQSMIKFYLDLPLGVHIPECVKRLAQCFILQSPQSNCNLHNPTAISTIRLQSQQSNCNLRNPTAISTINDKFLPWLTPRCPHSRVCQAPSTPFQTAISAIRLQSPQSDCNIHNQWTDFTMSYI